MQTINCKGKLIDLTTPRIMGVINLTPDSFYPGSRQPAVREALLKAGEMLAGGADFLDIGAYSSRPNADDISEREERVRLLPVLKAILREFPQALVSVDTFRSEIAREAIGEGAAIINDISGGQLDAGMFSAVAELGAPYILMHMRGTPRSMMHENQYDDILGDLVVFFSRRIAPLREAGVADIVIDPGFGFAKSPSQSFELLRRMDGLQILGCPVLVGLSRKSMLYKTLGTGPEDALNATTAVNMIALEKGASILRVHDVKEAVETVKIFSSLHSKR